MATPEYRSPPYAVSKPKQFGNLHERMQFVKSCKENLRDELNAALAQNSKASELTHNLFVSILDLETEVAKYLTDKRPRSR
jgi:predicted  nucleic acid-binding Zn-ribbon protein